MYVEFFTIIGILLIISIFILITKFNKNFRERAYYWFLKAEKEIGKGKKMDYVVEHIYALLPPIFHILPKSTYRKILQKIFNEIKDLLNYKEEGKK